MYYDMSPGKTIGGRYRVVASHRQGGLSTAYEVIDEQEEKTCELQFFPPILFDNQTQTYDFSATWEPWKRVESPYVARVLDIAKVGEGVLILITQFPEGTSMRGRLREQPRLPLEQVLPLGCKILEGLNRIHAHGLVHGDIKPNTIYVRELSSGLEPVLVDAGVTPGLWTAKHLGDKTTLIGTPYYAPVEQFGGESPDVQSDIYNVATVLFELITGTLPWPGKSFLEVFQAKLDKTPPSMGEHAPDLELPEGVEETIVGGLLASKKERYATAQEFLEKLSALV